MRYALASQPTPLKTFLARQPYDIMDDPISRGDLSNVAERAWQVFKSYYDHVTITRRDEVLREHFRKLADDWLDATRFTSSFSEMSNHPAYREIIDLGDQVVPLLLRELQDRPNLWFTALTQITGANPVQDKERGQIEKMRKAWLRWGKEQGFNW
jgi:hypothetical protein